MVRSGRGVVYRAHGRASLIITIVIIATFIKHLLWSGYSTLHGLSCIILKITLRVILDQGDIRKGHSVMDLFSIPSVRDLQLDKKKEKELRFET